LAATDEVALEATCNTHAIAKLLEPRVARVVVSNPQKTRAIAEAKVKSDKVDAQVLAQLLAADYLPGVWLADEETHALRRHPVSLRSLPRGRFAPSVTRTALARGFWPQGQLGHNVTAPVGEGLQSWLGGPCGLCDQRGAQL
jgi:hypothetical protein